MTRKPKTKHQLQKGVEDLRETDASTAARPADVAVEWGQAAPAARPDGMAWGVPDPDANADTATLQYDLWDAQRNVLDRI
jgi:hypothetical protein